MALRTNRKPRAIGTGAAALTMGMLRASVALLRKQGRRPKRLKASLTARVRG
jgi:hypothetical protein